MTPPVLASVAIPSDPKELTVSVTSVAELSIKAAPCASPSAADRISAARETFRARPIPAGLSHLDLQYLKTDQNSAALTGLLAYLGVLVDHGRLSPETVAEAVEYAVESGLAAVGAVPGLNGGCAS